MSRDKNARSVTRGTRGQSYVLESIAAAIVVLAGVIFAIQATAVTPLSVSTASQHVENQEQAMADTLLERTAANGTLQDAVRYWNPDARTFHNADVGGYLGHAPPNRFGGALDRTFRAERIATNVHVAYATPTGQKSKPMVYEGTPSNNAVTATYTVVLTDTDRLSAPGYTGHTLNASNATDAFYAPDIAPDDQLYNVMEVRLVVWQM